MACPFFEPRTIASPATHPNARLPLLDEYDGLCHAAPAPFHPPDSRRFPLCNQGNAQDACPDFLSSNGPTSLRYQITASDPQHLRVLVLEEKRHWPQSWRTVQFEIVTGELHPAPAGCIVPAQLLAFCRSYLRRFPGVE